ncbi:MAG: zinc-dependent metalloprotease family protein [Bacteroidota bacterium]|nr:zinc-dependent metalloprotease family protein [Bacteroidota bacterium]
MKAVTKLFICSFLMLSFVLSAQHKTERLWTKVSEKNLESLPKTRRNAIPSKAHFFQLNLQELKNELINAPVRGEFTGQSNLIISFPTASGNFEKFRVMESPIMHPDLAAKYPMIKTYAAQGIDDPTATMRFSVTQFGLHTMTISGKTSSNYIDPFTTDLVNYIVYDKESLNGTPQSFECLLEDDVELSSLKTQPSTSSVLQINDSKLRKYRLAQSCNAEYGNIFAVNVGTEKADIQAQMTITINRVNSVYERDLAVTLEFIANNDLIIYYGNTASDPWATEYNTKTAQTIDAVIGVANYDIGHNFNTSGGGNAGCLSCVCLSTSQSSTHKGRGYTGSNNPTGDPFDIDYVAHEMGHQFGGYHVMNTCSRSGNGATEVEPASGSSIMGYAGICATNVQNNSHDDFNYVNIRDIATNIKTGNSSSCASITNITNLPPTANAGSDYTIPKSTAFILEGTATDPDGMASLTYSWSQNDPTQSPGNAAPVSTYAVGPMYRALPPITSPNRFMPTITSVLAGNLTPTWEVTPSVARTMNFSFLVRDNDVLGGQTAADLMTVTVDGTAGPFVVTSQGTATTWNAGATETITWNVAGTTAAPVNAANVNIYLSTDGGYTYPTLVAGNLPNTGTANITVPSVTTTTGRIMVRGAGNIFYDINNANISIQAAEFVMNVANNNQSFCPPTNATYDFTYSTFLSFSETTTFSASGNPAGTTVSFNPTTAVTNGTPVQMSINGLTGAMAGTYTVTITGTSTSVTKTSTVVVNVQNPSPAVATLATPANGATGINTTATLTWNAVSGAGMLYDVDVASDAGFTTIVSSTVGTNLTSFSATGLAAATTYYWRVKAYTSCGTGSFSSTNSFTTSSCSNAASSNVPVAITATGTPTVTSTLSIPITGTITDVNVVGLIGTHTWINDLTITLKSPANTTVTLFGAICANQDNFDINFDDNAAAGALPCPPIGGGNYQPQTALSVFNGQSATGTWTLTVADGADADGGSLSGWGLQICTASAVGITKYEAHSSSISIYPNPTSGLFTVKPYGASNEVYTVKVINNLGQVIQLSEVNANTELQMDLRSYDAGVYFVTVSGDNKTETKKIILAKD